MDLRRYIARRLVQIVPLIFFVILINFFLIHTAPGDPAWIMAGEYADPNYVAFLRVRYGLDKPFSEQFVRYISRVINGDLGYSFTYQRPVLDVIMERSQATLLLMLSAQTVSLIIAILLGTFVAKRFKSKFGMFVSLTTLAMYSMPVFWSGLMYITIFSLRLGLFPTSGIASTFFEGGIIENILDRLSHLFLPLLTLVGYYMPVYQRLVESSIVEVMNEDFITTARAIGLTERSVFIRHALRNALLPVITVFALTIGVSFSGAILTETVFGWPGMGSLMYDAISKRDYPILMGLFLIVSVCIVIVTLIADIIYIYLDPRIEYR